MSLKTNLHVAENVSETPENIWCGSCKPYISLRPQIGGIIVILNYISSTECVDEYMERLKYAWYTVPSLYSKHYLEDQEVDHHIYPLISMNDS